MTVNGKDRTLLRDLATQVAEVASLPIMAERREIWKRHNHLTRVRPMILIFPEGSWQELLPEDALQCEGDAARRMERALRMRLYTYAHFQDDTVVEKEWAVHKVVRNTGWGLAPKYRPSTTERGAWGFDPVILEPEDLKKLRFPEIHYDEGATQKNLESAQALFGDILDVTLRGVNRISFHPAHLYCDLRGLDQVMWDMYDNPGMLHDAMAFLEAGNLEIIRQYEELNLLDLNNDGTYHSSGGVGYTDELPGADYDPERVRTCDIWASAEAQEMAQVSPDMHEEFFTQYERRLLQPFGLNGYGCCEDLTHKLDGVLKIPNIRRISVSPWADVEACAEKLDGNCIFSWKPNPAHLVGDFEEDRLREYIRHTLDATRECVIEMILKDTHTCERRPERFDRWTAIARELVEDY